MQVMYVYILGFFVGEFLDVWRQQVLKLRGDYTGPMVKHCWAFSPVVTFPLF